MLEIWSVFCNLTFEECFPESSMPKTVQYDTTTTTITTTSTRHSHCVFCCSSLCCFLIQERMPSTRMERNDKCDAMVMDHDAENKRTAQHLLQKLGFDPDHIHQYYLMDCSNSIHRVDVRNVTPLIYFILRGNLPMCRWSNRRCGWTFPPVLGRL